MMEIIVYLFIFSSELSKVWCDDFFSSQIYECIPPPHLTSDHSHPMCNTKTRFYGSVLNKIIHTCILHPC